MLDTPRPNVPAMLPPPVKVLSRDQGGMSAPEEGLPLPPCLPATDAPEGMAEATGLLPVLGAAAAMAAAAVPKRSMLSVRAATAASSAPCWLAMELPRVGAGVGACTHAWRGEEQSMTLKPDRSACACTEEEALCMRS